MGADISPEALLIIIAISVSFWLGQQVWHGVKKVEARVEHVAKRAGCGAKKVFTGHGCKVEGPGVQK